MVLSFTVITAIVMGIMQAVKQTTTPKQLLPFLAIILAMVIFGAWQGWTVTPLLTGIVSGLSAMGLYSGGKTAVGK